MEDMLLMPSAVALFVLLAGFQARVALLQEGLHCVADQEEDVPMVAFLEHLSAGVDEGADALMRILGVLEIAQRLLDLEELLVANTLD